MNLAIVESILILVMKLSAILAIVTKPMAVVVVVDNWLFNEGGGVTRPQESGQSAEGNCW